MLPDGYTSFVSTVGPAWLADKRPIYGGLFWVNGDGTFPVPREAYYMSGAGGQTTLIVPSHDWSSSASATSRARPRAARASASRLPS